MAGSTTAVAGSVIVPAHGRPAGLARCLAALAGQEPIPGSFEVIVIIDGEEGSKQIAAVAETSPVAPRVVIQAQAGPAAARNRGASLARGRWLAFTDDDCCPTPGWLQALVPELERAPDAVVGGAVRNGLTANASAEASQLVQDVAWAHFSGRADPARFFPSSNLALSREAFERVGRFDESFPSAAAEDRDLCDRALAMGLELRPAPAAVVDHYHELSPRRLWRQHHGYGRGAFHFQRARALRGVPPLRIAPGFHLALVRAPFSRAKGMHAILLAALIVTTQVAYVAGYAMERWRPGRTAA